MKKRDMLRLISSKFDNVQARIDCLNNTIIDLKCKLQEEKANFNVTVDVDGEDVGVIGPDGVRVCSLKEFLEEGIEAHSLDANDLDRIVGVLDGAAKMAHDYWKKEVTDI